ncbi:hypothetical protein [Paenibacillus endoradicis]|uniref:hypothetical protein n=1 Tax=Paenibacillus endoradicis TaxID=2972487 RepID=UPI0021592F99|nr:hypothetical protein [Paenibacillus endoradicis]MCR8656890.1 hypothetical protein [Paenibacillus endoradicis]
MMKRILITLIFIILTSAFTGCTVSEPNPNQNAISTNENISGETPKGTNEDNTEQTIEDNDTNDYSLIINNSIITLKDWDNKVDLQKILGEPISQNIEELGNEADTLKGSFIKTLEYDGLQIKLTSPKENGKDFWIMEMVVNKKDYKTSKGIEIGDKIEEVKNSYPDLEIALDGRTDPNNCAYVLSNEQVEYLQFEVKEGFVSEIKILYVMQ